MASQKKNPFFLYYVPTANHFQRNLSGDYAVPAFLHGVPIRGASKYTDGQEGGEREDMVLENDVAFGALIQKLKETEDPRSPGNKLIENTLIIFTSDNGPNVGDNEGINQESGDLRGKKAKLWEGGHRVPFVLYWKGIFENGQINPNLLSLTDLFSSFARIVGDDLQPTEAQDSLDCLDYWKDPAKTDQRARYFFCHLGPPYENDGVAIRKMSKKVIIQGGLAQPWIKKGSLGSAQSMVSYDLEKDPYEKESFSASKSFTGSLVDRLLQIHNQGYSRDLHLPNSQNLILDDGWHNLRNDISGSIGFEFQLLEDEIITHLGMWDDHDREFPIRSARGLPTEQESDQPSFLGKRPRSIQSQHSIVLWEMKDSAAKERMRVEIGPTNHGIL